MFILSCSAVLSPISTLCFFRINLIIASSKSSPATFMDLLTTVPPNDITAISVVPPPISTIMLPHALEMSIPAPMAAATGSSISTTFLAPAWRTASSTALFSTSVTPLGMQTDTVGFTSDFLTNALLIKYFIIYCLFNKYSYICNVILIKMYRNQIVL